MLKNNIQIIKNMRKTIKLNESELKRMIAESVKRILLRESDTRILDIKKEAENSLGQCMQMYNEVNSYNFHPQLKMERSEDGHMVIAVHLPQEEIKAIQYDQKIYDDFRKLAKYMNRCGFTLLIGPLFGDVLWEYGHNSEEMLDMWKKHEDRFWKRLNNYTRPTPRQRKIWQKQKELGLS